MSAAMTLPNLDPLMRAAAEAVLEPDETVRWLGIPDPSRSPGETGAGFTAAWVWLGITGLWQAGALTAALLSGFPEAWYYVGIGSLFMAIGLLLLFRALRERRDARRRLHLVTDRRVITIDLADPRRSLVLTPAEIGYAETVTRPGGAGDIEIGHGAPGTSARDADRFHHLRGVEQADAAIKAMRLLMGDAGLRLVTKAPED
ncbi:hypothetical protein [Phreatobacter sp.]|uniref:hypothetical protein n=1 Tax=Phreatobacter sp. TaxID=1966341 RepID=UPI003F705914